MTNLKKCVSQGSGTAIGRLLFTLILAVLTITASAQTKTVTGLVTDQAGEPIIGATVLVKGTKAGTSTDIDGRYSLKNIANNATLTFSYIGYETQSVSTAGKNIVDVVMKEANTNLDELVVIGYGTMKRRDLTGSVTSVKSAEILQAPTNNVMQALEGKISGMDITKSSGAIGSGVSVTLRGTRSIYGSDSPLYIIDGVPGGDYNTLNPADIESVDVLKDAASTAIYGSAGANGVIIITTKSGKAGRPVVNFDFYYGFSGNPNYKHGMVGDEWVNYQRESYKFINGVYPENMSTLLGNPDYLNAYDNGEWIDWVDEVSGRKATTQKYSLSVSAGGEMTKIYASAAYTKDTGLIENENQNRYNLRLSLDQKIFKFLSVGFTSNIDYYDRNNGVSKTFTNSLTALPLGKPYDEQGNINHEFINGQYSPLSDNIPYQYANNIRATNIDLVGYAEITPVKGLKLRSQISTDLNNSRQGQFWGNEANANVVFYGKTPYGQKTHNNSWAYTWENVLSYNADINDHSFGAQFITSYNKSTNEATIAGSGGFLTDSWQYHALGKGTDNLHAESSYTQTQKMSYAVRVNYSYKGKYLVSFSNRWDGVSWFSQGKKWDAFPAGAIAWRFSDEEFMESTRGWLDNAKIRLSYGVTGNSGGVGAYATQSQFYLYPSAGVTVDGKYVPFSQFTGTIASANLGWEKSYNWNVGLDFSVLRGRIDGSIDYYNTKTKDLLFQRTMPITTGATGWGSPLSSWQNLAKTQNYGLEITINSRNIQTRNFTWNTSLTATWNKEKIVSLPDGDIVAQNLFVGNPIKSLYNYKYAGIWGTNDDPELMKQYGVQPGFVKVETTPKVNDAGVSDNGVHPYGDADRQILGHSNPNWILGLNNTFTYRDFDATIFIMGRFGQTICSDLLGYYTAENSITRNQLAGVDYWTEDNQGAYYPRPGSAASQSKVMPALRYFNGSFGKIKNLTIGYTLPQKITQKAFIQRFRVYFTAYNPFIFCTKQLRGTDPETGGSDSFPTYRQFVFGVNLTF